MHSVESDREQQEVTPLDISFLDVYQLLELFVMLLSEKAWQHIGLRVNPRTNEITKDFERANVAIDCIISLVDKLELHLTGDAKNRLRSLITDLQINYARQLEQK